MSFIDGLIDFLLFGVLSVLTFEYVGQRGSTLLERKKLVINSHLLGEELKL